MATKPDAAKPEVDVPVKKPVKKKKLWGIGILVLLLVALGGGAWFFVAQQRAVAVGDESAQLVKPQGPPTFLPLDNMVVNLADAGGEKVAQIGITLELADSTTVDKVKMYLPSIRSGILLLISQRTAEELLLIEGKEKLAADILREASRPFGDMAKVTPKPAIESVSIKKKSADKKSANDERPVRSVLFSSFIVQ